MLPRCIYRRTMIIYLYNRAYWSTCWTSCLVRLLAQSRKSQELYVFVHRFYWSCFWFVNSSDNDSASICSAVDTVLTCRYLHDLSFGFFSSRGWGVFEHMRVRSGMSLHWAFLLLLQQTLGLPNDVTLSTVYCLLSFFLNEPWGSETIINTVQSWLWISSEANKGCVTKLANPDDECSVSKEARLNLIQDIYPPTPADARGSA